MYSISNKLSATEKEKAELALTTLKKIFLDCEFAISDLPRDGMYFILLKNISDIDSSLIKNLTALDFFSIINLKPEQKPYTMAIWLVSVNELELKLSEILKLRQLIASALNPYLNAKKRLESLINSHIAEGEVIIESNEIKKGTPIVRILDNTARNYYYEKITSVEKEKQFKDLTLPKLRLHSENDYLVNTTNNLANGHLPPLGNDSPAQYQPPIILLTSRLFFKITSNFINKMTVYGIRIAVASTCLDHAPSECSKHPIRLVVDDTRAIKNLNTFSLKRDCFFAIREGIRKEKIDQQQLSRLPAELIEELNLYTPKP